MHRHFSAALLAATLALTLVACGREAPAPAGPAPLTRPVVTLNVQTGPVLVPRTLIVERGGLPGVFVLNPDGVTRFRLVRTGHTRDGRVEIVSGLSGDETLVAGELNDVRDGSAVTPTR
jgi:hypothetical protein